MYMKNFSVFLLIFIIICTNPNDNISNSNLQPSETVKLQIDIHPKVSNLKIQLIDVKNRKILNDSSNYNSFDNTEPIIISLKRNTEIEIEISENYMFSYYLKDFIVRQDTSIIINLQYTNYHPSEVGDVYEYKIEKGRLWSNGTNVSRTTEIIKKEITSIENTIDFSVYEVIDSITTIRYEYIYPDTHKIDTSFSIQNYRITDEYYQNNLEVYSRNPDNNLAFLFNRNL